MPDVRATTADPRPRYDMTCGLFLLHEQPAWTAPERVGADTLREPLGPPCVVGGANLGGLADEAGRASMRRFAEKVPPRLG